MRNFTQSFLIGILFYALFTLTLGLLYPLGIYFVGNQLFPHQAQGSFDPDTNNGPLLIAQFFSEDKYFHYRYMPNGPKIQSSGGTNLSVIHPQYYERIKERKNNEPVFLLTQSASGLDPEIDLPSAYYQIQRISKARGMKEEEIMSLLNKIQIRPLWGIFGNTRINVLLANMELDKIHTQNK